jgi:hypothetical protein
MSLISGWYKHCRRSPQVFVVTITQQTRHQQQSFILAKVSNSFGLNANSIRPVHGSLMLLKTFTHPPRFLDLTSLHPTFQL